MKTLLLVILFSFYYHVVTPDIRFESLLHVYTFENLLLSVYTYFKKRCRGERRMAVVERKLHDRKELWFPYLVCKNNELFAWR